MTNLKHNKATVKRGQYALIVDNVLPITLASLIVVLSFSELIAQVTSSSGSVQAEPYFEVITVLGNIPQSIHPRGGRLLDYDSDGDLDLVANLFEVEPPTSLPMVVFRNDGGGNFSETTAAAFDGQIPETIWTRHFSTADFNGDGLMDYFIADHGPDNPNYANNGIGAQSRILIQTAEGKLREETSTRIRHVIPLAHLP